MVQIPNKERRQYIRLNSVFPVEIYLKTPKNGKSHFLQGFTRDISFGGICLALNDPEEAFVAAIMAGPVSFEVLIDMPLSGKPITAKVRSAWYDYDDKDEPRRLLLGVAFEEIAHDDKQRVVSMAKRMLWLPRIAISSIVILVMLLGVSQYFNFQVASKNRQLIENFYRAQEEVDVYKKSVEKEDEKYSSLRQEIDERQKLIDELNSNLKMVEVSNTKSIEILNAKLKTALSERSALEKKVQSILASKEETSLQLREVDKKRKELEVATIGNMYRWLKTHQNKFTGLVMSFEGDPAMRDAAFTYDQSLAAQMFLISNDIDRAKKVLSFYKDRAKKKMGAYLNSYRANTGAPSEEVVHVGPNVWIAIAACQYTNKTQDRQYLGIAEDVAKWLFNLKDEEGGIKGGPTVTWFSTEHNLDAYSLFNMLYQITKDEEYSRHRDETLKWIKENTYSKVESRMTRGKGDATIATDTLAWAIAAIGPATLMKESMDPDAIMKFAEDHCLVTTTFRRPSGEVVKVKGFDFAKVANVPRSGVISTEWTAQMVISYKMMASYYSEINEPDKAQGYRDKADYFLSELDKMVISSPSASGQGQGCLPYASQPNADTGHGWRTPQGGQTGSVSGTTYTLFAKKDFNPLSLD